MSAAPSSGPAMEAIQPPPTLEHQVAQVQAEIIALAAIKGNPEGKGFPDAPIFDGSKPEELRTWILQLRNKLAAQPLRYPTEDTCLRYTLNRMSGVALDLVRSYISEDTGEVTLSSLNELLELLRQAFDDPDRVCTATRKIRKLRQKNGTFATSSSIFSHRWRPQLERRYAERPTLPMTLRRNEG